MKKKYLSVAILLTVAASLTLTSCIGSFTLTNKLLSWNRNISNKFVNEVVFFAFWVLPVYEVSALADMVVLNSIEFWSGNNPLEAGTKVIEGENGRYLVNCDGKGYTITSEADGSSVRLDFDAPSQTWSVITAEGESYPFLTFVDDTHVKVPAADGSYTVVELSEAGSYAYRNAVTASQWANR